MHEVTVFCLPTRDATAFCDLVRLFFFLFFFFCPSLCASVCSWARVRAQFNTNGQWRSRRWLAAPMAILKLTVSSLLPIVDKLMLNWNKFICAHKQTLMSRMCAVAVRYLQMTHRIYMHRIAHKWCDCMRLFNWWCAIWLINALLFPQNKQQQQKELNSARKKWILAMFAAIRSPIHCYTYFEYLSGRETDLTFRNLFFFPTAPHSYLP